MAIPSSSTINWDSLTSITREKILPGIEDSISRDNALFGRLFGKAERLDGGRTIDQNVRYAISTQGGFYSGLDELHTGKDETRTRAIFNWRQLEQAITFSNIDIAKNGGSASVLKLLAEDMEDARISIKDKLGTSMYTAQTGDAIDSLVNATDDGTLADTYGNINRDTYTWWQGQYNATGGALSLSMLATEFDLCTNGSIVPTLMITDKTTWSAYEALLQPQVRIQLSAGGYPKIDGGFNSMLFRGTPLIVDEYCTSGYMYFLNEKGIKVYTLRHPKHPTDKMGFTVTDLKEPTNQDGQIGHILWWGNMICTNPRYQGVIRSIT